LASVHDRVSCPTDHRFRTFNIRTTVGKRGTPAVASGRAACRLAVICLRIPIQTASQTERTIWKETMKSFHVFGRTVVTAVIAFGVGTAVCPAAYADPVGTDQPLPPGPVPGATPEAAVAPAAPDAAAAPGGPLGPTGAPQGAVPDATPLQSSGDPTRDACDLFNKSVNYAAINYEDFADFSAGSGNFVNYDDQTVGNANTAGRTALKQAAAAALSASGTPGLPPEVSTPMRTWSLNAAKLVLVMGVRGGGDTLNSTATDMNTSAHEAQIACALAQQNS
jgi:hypothetical protein